MYEIFFRAQRYDDYLYPGGSPSCIFYETKNRGIHMIQTIKKISFAYLISIIFISISATSAPASLFGYVLSHPAVTEIESSFPNKITAHLVKVEQIATYRCPNCFDFRLTYEGYTEKKPLKFVKIIQARGMPDNSVSVTVIKP